MSLTGRLRTSFVAGLVLLLPLAVTLFVLQFAFAKLTGVLLDPIVRATRLVDYTGNVQLLAQMVAAVSLVGFITLLGYIASRDIGNRLFGSFERAIGFVPFVRTVYFGVRQVGESLSERSEAYESVVLVEFHRTGLYSIGFVTNESPRAARDSTGRRLYNVFLPNSPNPTAGQFVMVPEEDIHEVDISVRRGLRLLVTTGISVEDVEELPEPVQPGGPSGRGAGAADADAA